MYEHGATHSCWCGECRKAYDAARWQANKLLRKEQKRRQVREVKAWFFEFKSTIVCVDCRSSVHPAALQWDHLPGVEKVANVSDLIESGLRLKALKEMEKCEPVCANCHAVRTYTRSRA